MRTEDRVSLENGEGLSTPAEDSLSPQSSALSPLRVAEPTGFEPATSDVTGRRSNQLNYDSALQKLRHSARRVLSIKTGGRYWVRTSDPRFVRPMLYR